MCRRVFSIGVCSVFVVFIAFVFLSCSDTTSTEEIETDTSTDSKSNFSLLLSATTNTGGQKRIAGDSFEFENVFIHYNSIQVHSVENGWILLDGGPSMIDLLTLNDEALHAIVTTHLEPGSYTQIRFYVSKATIVLDAQEQEIKLASKTIKIIKPFTISADEASLILGEYDLTKSIHQKGNGSFIMTPVINAGKVKKPIAALAGASHKKNDFDFGNNTGTLPNNCAKIEDGQIGEKDISVSVGDVTVTFSNWVTKEDEEDEFIGFDYTVEGGDVTITVKAATEVFLVETEGSWSHPEDMKVRAISNIVVCVEEDNSDPLPKNCSKIEGDSIGEPGITIVALDDSVTISEWFSKEGEDNEFIGFNYTSEGEPTIIVKAGKEKFVVETEGSWMHPEDIKVHAISNIVVCCPEE